MTSQEYERQVAELAARPVTTARKLLNLMELTERIESALTEGNITSAKAAALVKDMRLHLLRG